MADAVTYADLKFTEIPRREKTPEVSNPEGDSDYLDATYENVVIPPKEKKELTAPPRDRCHLLPGIRNWAPRLALLLLLLCLLLSAVTIERTIKYVQASSDLQALTTNHQAMNQSLLKTLQSKEQTLSTLRRDLQNTEQRVEHLTEETERIQSTLQKTKEELQRQTFMTSQVQSELERAEKMLGEEQSKLSQWERDICPGNWILFGRSCLLITNEERSWEQCDKLCRTNDANLIVVQWDDQMLQDFLSKTSGESWVGKELKWKKYEQSWEWPQKYWTRWEHCWQITDGKLMSEKCSEKKTCVCAKNLILVNVKREYTRDHPQLFKDNTKLYSV
ncbi:uncharacterized protein [Engystomops pustulosus]|uniref:uncharacterized protein n=1 Tax=Engystomops pustulosus TaxID=76066 RepID=UPI003AFA2DE8